MENSEQHLNQYQSFCESVRETVHQRMGSDYEVTVHTVVKNNNVKLDSLIIRKEHAVVMPSIYLNSFYDEYKKGREWDEIINEILRLYEQNQFPCDNEFSFTYEDLKDTIFYRLINYEKNREILVGMPHYRVGDYAITFYCMVIGEDDCMGTIRLTKEHLELFGVSEEKIFELACTNSAKLLPPTIRTMDEVMDEILWEQLHRSMTENGNPECTQEYMNMIIKRREEEPLPMYILSNVKGTYGASALLEVGFLDAFRKARGEDFYILPSSVHEVILIPVSRAPELDKMEEMVADINATQVPEQEFLSNQVLRYREFRELLPTCLLPTE